MEYSRFKEGILLIACGKTYGKYANNLAASIKHFNSDIKIHLCCDEITIEYISMDFFDIIDICFDYEKKDWCEIKCNINKYSPFERTLYLDVDAVCLKDLSALFEALKTESIFIQKTDSKNIWATNEIVSEHYGKKINVNTVQTSIIYFDRSESSNKFFHQLAILNKNRLPKTSYKSMWGASRAHPDELYYSIAFDLLGLNIIDFRPIFFAEKHEKVSIILNNYYLLSQFGGISTSKAYSIDLYCKLMRNYFKNLNKKPYDGINLYKNKFVTIK